MGDSTQKTNSVTNTSQQSQFNQNQTGNTSTTAWAPQLNAVQQIIQQAQNAGGVAGQATAPTDFTATMTPQQLAIFNAMATAGTNLSNTNTGVAMAGGSALPVAYNNAESALTNLNGYDPTKVNNAGGVLGTAQQYVNGVNIPAEVQNAMQSAEETARDVTNPQTVNAAASSGNVNSSRTDLAQGLVDRALAEQAGNLSGTLQNQAWNTGANLGETIAGNNQTAGMTALEAALSGGIGLGNSGVLAANSGTNGVGTASDVASVGAAGPQTNTQLQLQNQLQQYLSAISSPFNVLNQEAPLIENGNWGSNTTSSANANGTSSGTGTSNTNATTTTSPSAFQVIGGLLGAGGSLLGGTGLGSMGTGSSGLLGLINLLPK